MLQLTPKSIIFLATIPVDFRKGIDGLAAVCRTQLNMNPLDGAIFLFYNNSRTTIKILTYDGQGFWLFIKRISKGKFKHKNTVNKNNYQEICYRSLSILINNGDPYSANLSKDWRKIPKQRPTPYN